MRVRSLIIFFALLLYTSSYPLWSQTRERYKSKTTYDKSSKELIKKLRDHISDEFKTEESTETIRKITLARIRYLKLLVEHKAFIQDQSLETYVNDIVSRVVEANQLEARPRTVLVMKTQQVNAVNYGKGIFFVTLGMLGRTNTDDELAFAIAHEIAHDEMAHVRKNILRLAEAEENKILLESLKKVLNEKSEAEDDNAIEVIRKTISEASRFSKKAEFEADSLGTTFFTRAGYSPQVGESLFDILKNPTGLKNNIGIEFLLPLHSEAYPLQDEWFGGKFNENNRPTGILFGLSVDSLQSHPELNLRRQKYKLYKYEHPVAYPSSEIDFKDINRIAELELIELCYEQNKLIQSLFLALQLLHEDPVNPHIISRISKILLDLRSQKEDGFQRRRIFEESGYSNELKLLSNMVHNMNKYEVSELAYHFISNNIHFHAQEPSHYYLRWRICLVTNRPDEANALKKEYNERFKSTIDTYKFK